MSEPTLLAQAIAAVKAGDTPTGVRLLAQVIQEEPNNEMAWMWLAACMADTEKKRFCLQKVLEINPQNERVREVLEEMQSGTPAEVETSPQESASTPPTPAVEPEPVPAPEPAVEAEPTAEPRPEPQRAAQVFRPVDLHRPAEDLPVIQRGPTPPPARPAPAQPRKPLTRADRLRQKRMEQSQAARGATPVVVTTTRAAVHATARTTAAAPRFKRSERLILLLAVLGVLIVLGGIGYLAIGGIARTTPPPYVPPTPVVRPTVNPALLPTPIPTNDPNATPTPAATISQNDLQATLSSVPAMPTIKAKARLAPEAWKKLPVIPIVSDTARAIYQRGQQLGNNPRAFSKIGDCDSTLPWFLGDFDAGPEKYNLGGHTDLQPAIDYFYGSFGRTSLSARNSFNTASVVSPLWADTTQCQTGEGPIQCEYRLQRPSFAIIALGTNDGFEEDVFESQMRAVIQISIERGVVPILATKADNLEGDDRNNTIIANLSREYDVPLWNFWRAVQDLPNGGLQDDNAHLTPGINFFFDDTTNMSFAWPNRNLTALQALDAVWRGVTNVPTAPTAAPTAVPITAN